MKEVYKNLCVGNFTDYLVTNRNWKIVHAAKEPYHRQAIGYKGRALSKDHPEYLFAIRKNELSLNMIDTPGPEFINKIMIDEALKFIDQGLKANKKVLINCNHGESRSPSIAFLYMASKHLLHSNYDEAIEEFKSIYPLWKPKGIIKWIKANWLEYVEPLNIPFSDIV